MLSGVIAAACKYQPCAALFAGRAYHRIVVMGSVEKSVSNRWED